MNLVAVKRFLPAAFLLALSGTALFAQEARQQAPTINYKVVEDFFKVPQGHFYGEAVGIAVSPEGHILTLNRNAHHPFEEFAADGSFVREFGGNTEFIYAPHTIRYDKDGNLWDADVGNNLIVKFDKNLRIKETLGSRPEPWVFLTHGIATRSRAAQFLLSAHRHRCRPRWQRLRHRRLRQFPRRQVRYQR